MSGGRIRLSGIPPVDKQNACPHNAPMPQHQFATRPCLGRAPVIPRRPESTGAVGAPREPVATSLRDHGISAASLWQRRCKFVALTGASSYESHNYATVSNTFRVRGAERTLSRDAPHPVRDGRSRPRHAVPFRSVFVYMCALFGPFVYREVPSSPIAQLRSGTNGAGWNNYWEISPSAGRPAWC